MAYIFLFGSLILGLIIGSFLNCLVWRLYKNKSLWGRSYCPKCLKKIHWYDNIPVLSWLALKGSCRHCRQAISVQYPLVEFITGILFVLVFIRIYGHGLAYSSLDFYQLIMQGGLLGNLVRAWLIVAVMIMVFIYDARWLMISLPAIIWSGVLILIFDLALGYGFVSILLAVLIGAAFFGLQFLLTKGRGIGEGDIWLGGLMGLMFPDWRLLLTAILSSYIIGAITGLVMMFWAKKGLKTKVPLGVFLALGAIITLFFGSEVIRWYWGLLSA